jgi:hypothetical protein
VLALRFPWHGSQTGRDYKQSRNNNKKKVDCHKKLKGNHEENLKHITDSGYRMPLKHQLPEMRETETWEFLINNLDQSSDPFINFHFIQGFGSEVEFYVILSPVRVEDLIWKHYNKTSSNSRSTKCKSRHLFLLQYCGDFL